ncbi:TAXI family TRAP transporter solute-binding subunit [Methylobacterium planeticum]|uniref:TAXI family TRAP transporter solute-binding subunit n=1 Tax=Methylobacterium planeticum TaxID=2615211 RepID=A0A6N6MNW9_9HYPH|nr:TAXI family TRAP transporter solute-binding subunit [Methylobacterium planeticum]KAB1071667.1 hypothetical protein F6X51_19110 [Methylobacterium planeticum]
MLGLMALACALGSTSVYGQAGIVRKVARAEPPAAITERANAGVVTVISGTVSGTFIQIANDLAFVLDDGDRLRILPIIGKGAEQNLRDILVLKGVDLGIVRSDGLEAVRKDPRLSEKAKSLAYVVRLFTDEAHLIAGPEITDVHQLAGKRVNFDLQGSGANFTGRLIFERLGIAVEATNYDQPTSYEMLKRGEIAATFQMSGKPISAVAKLDPASRLHLVEIPFDPSISDLYLPGQFTREDYPNLVSGAPVGTVAVSSVLAVYNWPERSDRYQRVARFVDSFFSKLSEFQKPPRHPKWTEVNLAAEVPGWTRFKAAQDWLARASAGEKSTENTEAKGRATFDRFMASRGSDAVGADKREALFRDFVEWQRRNEH